MKNSFKMPKIPKFKMPKIKFTGVSSVKPHVRFPKSGGMTVVKGFLKFVTKNFK